MLVSSMALSLMFACSSEGPLSDADQQMEMSTKSMTADPMAGTIQEEAVLHATQFDETLYVASTAGSTAPGNIVYSWQYNTGEGWVATSGSGAEFEYGGYALPAYQYEFKLRRVARSGSSYYYSNECTVINHAFNANDPEWGTEYSVIEVNGDSDPFIFSTLVDTRGPVFTHLGPGMGRPVCFALNLETDMTVQIVPYTCNLANMYLLVIGEGSLPGSIIYDGAPGSNYWYYQYRGLSFEDLRLEIELGGVMNMGMNFAELTLPAGEYHIYLKGDRYMSYNNPYNGLIHTTITGMPL